jgi:hypothetical protein
MAAVLERKSDLVHRALAHLTQAIAAAERVHIKPINFHIELGCIHLMRLDVTTAARIFEMAFYGRHSFSRSGTPISTVKQHTARMMARNVDSHAPDGAYAGVDSVHPTQRRPNVSYRPNEFGLQPFCGIALAACYTAMETDDAQHRAMEVIRDVHELLNRVFGHSESGKSSGKGKPKVSSDQRYYEETMR